MDFNIIGQVTGLIVFFYVELLFICFLNKTKNLG